MKDWHPENDPSLPKFDDFRDTSRRFVILLVALLVLGLAGYFAARPVYRWFKTKRAVALVEQGNQAMQQADWDEVSRVVQTTLQLAPANEHVLRLAARYCSQGNLVEGLHFWQQLKARNMATLEDDVAFARLALAVGRTDLITPLLETLRDTQPNDRRVLGLLIQLQRQKGSPAEALQTARAWLERSPGDSEAELTLGGLLLGSGLMADRREGRGLLWGIALGDSAFRWEAAQLLAKSAELTSGELRVLLKQVQDQPDRQPLRYTLWLRLEPERRAEIVNQFVQESLAEGSLRRLAQAAAWLAEHEEVARVPEVLPKDKVEKHPPLLTARLQALIETGNLEEVQPYLEMERPPVEEYMMHCLQALAAQEAGKPQLIAGHFEQAISACGNRPGPLRFVGGYAERIAQPQAAIAAYRRLMAWPAATVEAARRILPLASGLNDTPLVRETLMQLAAFMPGDENVALAAAYFAGVMNEVTADTKSRLLKLLGEKPANPDADLVLALLELRLGDNGRALTRLESRNAEWLRGDPRRQVVYVAVLGANRQREAARQIARQIDTGRLKPEEKLLISEWLP